MATPFRYYQQRVVHDLDFRATVEASLMLAAYDVLNEDPETPGHAQRKGVAESLFRGSDAEIERFVRIFAWRAVFDPAIQTVVYDVDAQKVTPERIVDADLDRVVRGFWNTASGVDSATGVAALATSPVRGERSA